MDVNCHTQTRPTEVRLREFGVSEALREPFVTLDFHQPNDRLSIFISQTPKGRAIAGKIIELLQEAFFTPRISDTTADEIAASEPVA